MVVDDESRVRATIAKTLKSEGYEVVEASTGQETLARAKEEWPVLIILDFILPDLPGTEVLKQLRADPLTKAIPVLLLTGKPMVASQHPDFQEHSDEILQKPSSVDELLDRVHRMIVGRKR